jgi:DnaD and phage-associated domain
MDKVIDKTAGFHFTMVDNYILSCAGLNAMEQIVYIHLKSYTSHENRCIPGITRLAGTMGTSPNTIRKILKCLKEKGYIDIQQRFNTSNEYTLLPYPEYKKEIKESPDKSGESGGIGYVLKAYQNNINPVYGSMEREKLLSWVNTFDGKGEIVIKAIETAVLQGVRKIKYIESVLLNWHEAGVRSLQQCEALQKQWEERRRDNKNGTGGFVTDTEAGEAKRYDFSKYGDISVQ